MACSAPLPLSLGPAQELREVAVAVPLGPGCRSPGAGHCSSKPRMDRAARLKLRTVNPAAVCTAEQTAGDDVTVVDLGGELTGAASRGLLGWADRGVCALRLRREGPGPRHPQSRRNP